jgi:hypothetical protein
MSNMMPVKFETIEQLDDFMSRPSDALISGLEQVPGDNMVIGVGGKMGPTLARMAKRACPDRRVIGVARFSEPGLDVSMAADLGHNRSVDPSVHLITKVVNDHPNSQIDDLLPGPIPLPRHSKTWPETSSHDTPTDAVATEAHPPRRRIWQCGLVLRTCSSYVGTCLHGDAP